MKQYIKSFEQSLAVINLAPGTIKLKIWKLTRFIEYLNQNSIDNVDNITTQIIEAYRVEIYHSLNEKGHQNSVAYQNSMLTVIRQFTRYLYKQNLIVSDPGKDIRYAKIPKTLPKSVLTPKEAKKIIHAPDLRTITGYRDRTILEILYSSGIRKDEVNQLTTKGVDYHDGYLMIENGKGGKDRIVPIGKIACRYLENYIKSVRPELLINKGVDHLFLSLRGRQLSKNVVWDLVKKYAKKARIKKNVHPHTFRHTCATGMLKNKADLNTIRKILGHSSLNTTQIYTHLNISDLKAVHKKCHPREKDKV
ncbi:MAG: tyrosine-type recombinase/integrase [Proteobacteria bacterium]|nr:tyrosine-type recombinase/integrase [Pseudomonadota bacterium]MBU1585988.1 tyrosine-type recombinase/integrase [Pseudomonadota bacterium]MBU2453475.1 tyrosine-type recombinase/integrase [Pseudomonadota bacterium]